MTNECALQNSLINIVLKKGGEFPINSCISYIWTTLLTDREYVYKIYLCLFKKVLGGMLWIPIKHII